MSHTFLLDEKVLIWPIESGGRTEGGLKAARLWCEIGRNCHRILMSARLAGRYDKHLARRRSKLSDCAPVSGFQTALLHVVYGKAHWVDDSQPACEEHLIRHLNDRFLARIAVRCPGCIVVSAERSGQTLEDFRRHEFSSQGIRAVELDEALELARQPGS